MSPVRVVRILEHTYADAEEMARDMERWQLGQSRVYRPNAKHTIRSATLPPEFFPEEGAER